ncbi:hypothetical protein HYC85_018271 [Camellia sinensis]|uniref:Ubiquitin-specific protease family C19-related protein n=1 Tax=Camellia sinensis TaxID=4442 RepID=A0A7J7GXJ8_CAMSI|nr:hypothetical protein HYC85_018271 [Camellia sinensis]
MGTRIPSHQLSNGLYVSGPPEHLKERQPTMGSRSVPYTGGDIKHSGELGKMFDIAVVDHHPPPPSKTSRSSSSQHNSGSLRSAPNSGPIGPKSSGPMTPLQPTGLITSGPLGSSAGRRSGKLEPPAGSAGKAVYGSAVTNLSDDVKLGFKLSKPVMWVFVVVAVMGSMIGAFLMVAVKKVLILPVVAGILAAVTAVVVWNCAWMKRGLLGFLNRYPDAELRGAIDGQYVKVTGVVTCGSIPLESSFQRVPRCVYVSTELYEYRGWGGKSANPKHCFFSWGCRQAERYVADFYISDFQSGLRALVKAGYGAKVAAFVKPTITVDSRKENRDLSPSFVRYLADRSLSSDDHIMRLKEGYIKEGCTVSVMGVVRRHDNVLMIVPSTQPVSAGCQWIRCLLPTYIEGLILTCDESQNADVVPV